MCISGKLYFFRQIEDLSTQTTAQIDSFKTDIETQLNSASEKMTAIRNSLESQFSNLSAQVNSSNATLESQIDNINAKIEEIKLTKTETKDEPEDLSIFLNDKIEQVSKNLENLIS